MNDLGLTDAKSNLKELEKNDALTREAHNLYLLSEIDRMKDNKATTDSMMLELYFEIKNAEGFVSNQGVLEDIQIYLEDEMLICR